MSANYPIRTLSLLNDVRVAIYGSIGTPNAGRGLRLDGKINAPDTSTSLSRNLRHQVAFKRYAAVQGSRTTLVVAASRPRPGLRAWPESRNEVASLRKRGATVSFSVLRVRKAARKLAQSEGLVASPRIKWRTLGRPSIGPRSLRFNIREM
jgi:hypothetical protein